MRSPYTFSFKFNSSNNERHAIIPPGRRLQCIRFDVRLQPLF
jgi:hypothetical protein